MELEIHGIQELIQFGTDVILRSGERALNYYGKGKNHIKFDEGLVTEAELHLMEFFQDELHNTFPEHQMFKNNQNMEGYTHEEKRYLWIYDPLDGVANFQAGIPIWGISLALLDNFWPIFGMFYMPSTDDLFQAQAGQKAMWRKEVINTSTQENINDESLLLTYSRFHRSYHCTFPGKIRDLGCTGAHICYTAMGSAEAALIANESYQGLAAANVIIEAAGGKIYKMDGSKLFINEYLDGQKIDDHLLVVAPHLYSQVRECIKEIN